MIREVKSSEIDVLCEVSRQTFIETFAAVNTPKDLQDYLERNLTVEKLTAEFDQPHSFFYFLEKEGEIAGFLKLNLAEAQTEYQQDDSLEVERIYIKQAFQGQGCGKELFAFALEQARKLGKKKVWLGVWEHNEKALKFYKCHGFRQIDAHTFWMGDDPQTDYIYQLEL